jgi:cellulose synthase (UDP-forming)
MAAVLSPAGVTIKDKVLIAFLVAIAIVMAEYFGEWWFYYGHIVNIPLYIILSFVVFWDILWSLINWYYLLNVVEPENIKPREGLSVDVFTTAAPGEPYEMFRESLKAMRSIRYPHKTFLLDGSGNRAIMELCAEYGIERIDCTGIDGAKAGKINYALKQTSGEFILIIDPDHIPDADFLDKVLGHFDDPGIGFVQVVQAYYNQSSGVVARAAAEQTYAFYGPVLMGMYHCGCAVVVGANCTLRRKALETINGHAVHLAEDIATSMRLHSAGWRSVYVPLPLSHGLVPEDIGSYFKQQMKWATGMFNLFFKEYPSLFRGLTWRQRFLYFTNGIYYINGLMNFLGIALTILFLVFGWQAVDVSLADFLLHISPFVVAAFCVEIFSQRWLREASERGIHWRGALLKTGTWPVYMLSLLCAIAGKQVPYTPTPKTKGKQYNTAAVLYPHITVILVSLAAIAWCAASGRLFRAGSPIMVFFAVCNIILMSGTILISFGNNMKKPAGAGNGY